MDTEQLRRRHAGFRSKQIVALRGVHGSIDRDEWGDHYFAVINAVEAALSAMDEAEAEIHSFEREA